MKKIILLISFFAAIACSKTELMDYSGKEGIYFYIQRVPVSGYGDTTIWSANATTTIEFTKIPVADTTLKLRVRITGNVKDYDRAIKVKINKDSTTAVENTNYVFDANNLIVKAGLHYCDIPITIKRADNLITQTLQVRIQLEENEHFKLAFDKLYSLPGSMPMSPKDEGHNPSLHTIYMNFFLVRPSEWVPKMDYQHGKQELGLLGQFSVKKFNVISEVCSITYDEFTNPSTMPNVRVQVINQMMKAYLISQFNSGNPILEDDGRLMWVMGVPWNSFIGVPYVPTTTK